MALPKPKPAKQTYYMNRGKVHLTKDENAVWCGVSLENVSHATTEVVSVTCQRCLMHMTAPRIKAKDKAKEYKAIRHNMERNARIAERKVQ